MNQWRFKKITIFYGDYKFINIEKKSNGKIFYIHFKVNLKEFSMCDEIYIDATFKFSPKGY